MRLTKDECQRLFAHLLSFSQTIQKQRGKEELFSRMVLLARKLELAKAEIAAEQLLLSADDEAREITSEVNLFQTEAEYLVILIKSINDTFGPATIPPDLFNKVKNEVQLSSRKAALLYHTEPSLTVKDYKVLSELCFKANEIYKKSFAAIKVDTTYTSSALNLLAGKIQFMALYIEGIIQHFKIKTPFKETILTCSDLTELVLPILDASTTLINPSTELDFNLGTVKRRLHKEIIRLEILRSDLLRAGTDLTATKVLLLNYKEAWRIKVALNALNWHTQLSSDDKILCEYLIAFIRRFNFTNADRRSGYIQFDKQSYDLIQSALTYHYNDEKNNCPNPFRKRKGMKEIEQCRKLLKPLDFE